jgi:hypothetical protein
VKELPDTITIWGKDFSHRFDANEGVHIFENGTDSCQLKTWTFAEKGAATDSSIVLDETSGEFHVDTARFNEALLLASLVKAQVNGKPLEINLASLQKLPVIIGDGLLNLAQLVNGLALDKENGTDNQCENLEPDTQLGNFHLKIGNDEYLLKGWTWGKKNEVTSRSLTYDETANQARVNIAVFNELMLLATLVKAPFEITQANIQKLPAPVGDTLLRATQQINGITFAEKKTS